MIGRMLATILFPKTCFQCGSLGKYICVNCSRKFRQATEVCPYCERKSPYGITHKKCKKKLGIDGLKSVYYYNNTLQNIIKVIKYKYIRLAIHELMGTIPQGIWRSVAHVSDRCYSGSIIIPIPLHENRKRKRGFNQAFEISKSFAIFIEKEIVLNILKRKRDTASQAQLQTAVERHINMKDAFVLEDAAPIPESVVIVDDVWTTGTTIKEAARTLKLMGVKRVFALTLARRR